MSAPAIPICHDDVERAVLGALLLQPERIGDVRMTLVEADFSTTRHRLVWRTLCALDDRRVPIDMVTLAESLRAGALLELIGGQAALTELGLAVTSASHVTHHARCVADASKQRQLHALCDRVKARIPGVGVGTADASEFLESVERDVHALSDRSVGAGVAQSVQESLPEVLLKLRQADSGAGLLTGFEDLDAIVRGARPGELHIFGARPGRGKSAVAGQITQYAAGQGRFVLFFSLEMERSALIERMLCNVGGIASEQMRDRNFQSGQDIELLDLAAGRLGPIADHITIDDTPGTTLTRARAIARRQQARHGLDLIVVDYLQLMRAPECQRRFDEVSTISRGLKALAKELKVPVLALAQLSRAVEADGEPRLHHLRESGDMEQDSDVVVLLHSAADEDNQPVATLKARVAKNRHGRQGCCELTFEKRYFVVRDLARPRPEVVFDHAAAARDGRVA